MIRVRLFPLLVATVILCGCQKPAGSAPLEAIPGLPTKANPKLQTMKIWIGPEEMIAELALNTVQQNTGMMFRTNMDENAGMLFPLPTTTRASFWMKNCPLPLSAAYIDPDGIIVEIRDFQPQNTNAVVAKSENIRFVLETNQGWFKRHNIKEGMSVRTEHGPLMETFFRNN